MATLDEAAVGKLARLARLTLSTDETQRLTHDLANILAYVDKLKAVNLENLAATSHATGEVGPLREDIQVPGLPLERALGNAPEPIGDGFGVPKIIES